MECCVNALVTSFKETILAECPGMIKRNETESECAGRPTSQRVQQPDDAPSFTSDRCTRDHTHVITQQLPLCSSLNYLSSLFGKALILNMTLDSCIFVSTLHHCCLGSLQAGLVSMAIAVV